MSSNLHPQVELQMLAIEVAFDVAEKVDKAMVQRLIGDTSTEMDVKGLNAALFSLFAKEED